MLRFTISAMLLQAAISTTLMWTPQADAQMNTQSMTGQTARQPVFDKIEQLTQSKGQYIEQEGVYRVGFPREDITETVAGVKVTPPMGLSVWAAFKMMGNNAMVMGDLVLQEDQVNPVLSAALDNGLQVTAIHNHFLWDSPRVMFMHIGGEGNAETMATAVGKVFAKIKETEGGKGEIPTAQIDPAKSTLDPKKIDAILGAKGQLASGVCKYTFGRTTEMQGEQIGNAMGVNTWAAFAGSDEKAVVDGDFVMQESEVQSVLKALRHANIDITALHNHMETESPRLVFLHYWGIGPTTSLAKGLKAALDVEQHAMESR